MSLVVRPYAATPEALAEEQPLVAPTRVLAYEGRVDNRPEIARALGAPELARASDGAVLAAAYDAWGPELSARAIGEYAWVVYDCRSGALAAGQDCLGVRRVFYGELGGRLVVASNLRLLFERFPDIRPGYDLDVLPEYFTGTLTPWSGGTIWRGIRELERGHALVMRGRYFGTTMVWRPRADPRKRRQSAPEVDETFRAHLVEGVRAALRAPGPILCDLSGGFDSSTVCTLAVSLARAGDGPGPIVARSLVNRRSNEAAVQEAVRRHLEIESLTLDISDHPSFGCFTDAELPTGGFVQMGAINRATRNFAAERGIRAALNGQGADALFFKGGGGLPVYLADWFREGRLGDWFRHVAGYLRSGTFNARQLLWECTAGTVDLQAGSRAPAPDWLTPRFRGAVRDARHRFLEGRARVSRSDARERIYRWTLGFVPLGGAALPDERLPLLHRPLVEFLLGLDWEHLVRPGEERVLMRRALRGVLPEVVRSGRCAPAFGAALIEGLRAAWPRVSGLLTGERLGALGVVEPGGFRAAIETMRAGYEGPNLQATRTALYLETWLAVKAAVQPAPVSRQE